MNIRFLVLIALVFTLSLAHAEGDDVYVGPAHSGASAAPAKRKHIALAAGMTTFAYNVGQTVNVGGGRDDDPKAAREIALKRCAHPDFPELASTCHIVEEAEDGCLFIVKGTAPWGTTGYGTGTTPQSAYDDCHAKSLDCFKQYYGGCANPKLDVKWPGIVEAPKMKTVMAVAVGVIKRIDGSGTVANAASAGLSATMAGNWARASCSASGVTCTVAKVVEHGCLWVSSGWDVDANSRAHSGYGETKEEALAACEALAPGGTCREDTTRGGCVQGD